MEASIRQLHNREKEEEDDLDFLSIKVHDRFCGNYNNHEDDEFISDDEFLDESHPYQRGCFENPSIGVSPEVKKETFSMLDSVRSHCQKSGHGLGLDVLNLKSDDVGLGSLRSGPPFGDPLLKDDIFDSALSLLDDRKCREFRERGFFDGLIDEAVVSAKDEGHDEREDDFDAKDCATLFNQKMSEPCCSTGSKPKLDVNEEVRVFGKLSVEPNSDGHRKRQPKPKHGKIETSSGQRLKNNKSSQIPSDNLSIDELVKYINGDVETRKSPKKLKPASSILAPTSSHTKKQKRQGVKESSAAVQMLFQTGKNNPGKTENINSANSLVHAGNTDDGEERFPIDWIERDSNDKFTTVCHSTKLKAPKDASHSSNFLASGSLPTCRVRAYASSSPTTTGGPSVGSAYLSCPTTELLSNESVSPKRGSFSSVDEPPPCISEPSKRQITDSTDVVSAGSSYASVLVKNLPTFSVKNTEENSSRGEPRGGHSTVKVGLSSSEPEFDILLSPLQSEADTGFSSSSSTSPEVVFSTRDAEVSVCRNRKIDECCRFEVLMSGADVSEAACSVVTQGPQSSDTDSSKFQSIGLFQNLTGVNRTNSSSILCRQPPVIFDTQSIRLDSPTQTADIIFGYDPVDDEANENLLNGFSNCSVLGDAFGITFSGSPSCSPSESSVSQSNALTSEVPTEEKQQDYCFIEQLNKPLLAEKNVLELSQMEEISSAVETSSAKSSRDLMLTRTLVTGVFPEDVLKNPDNLNLGNIVTVEKCGRQSVSPVCFDLLTAQKFLNKAFKDVLSFEGAHPGRVIRL